jgi:hypothetical protein
LPAKKGKIAHSVVRKSLERKEKVKDREISAQKSVRFYNEAFMKKLFRAKFGRMASRIAGKQSHLTVAPNRSSQP